MLKMGFFFCILCLSMVIAKAAFVGATRNLRGNSNKETTTIAKRGLSAQNDSSEWSFSKQCPISKEVFVSSTNKNSQDKSGFGSELKPYSTIKYAIRMRERCQTIRVMAGTYKNSGVNSAVAPMTGVSFLRITNYKEDYVTIKFDGPGGFLGGNEEKPVSNIEIAGMHIEGPNNEITFGEAFENRLNKNEKKI